jgi:sporulation protein YlmC with PRC-barrel domain
MNAAIVAADVLEGGKIVDARGRELGTIEDIMIDVRGGAIAYAVMACGGFLGLREERLAVPWDALRLDEERQRFVLEIERDRIAPVPGYGADRVY